MTETVTRYYTGPVDEITLVLEDGRQIDVARGGKVEVGARDAQRLDAQNTDERTHWAKRADAAAVKEARALPMPLTAEQLAASAPAVVVDEPPADDEQPDPDAAGDEDSTDSSNTIPTEV